MGHKYRVRHEGLVVEVTLDMVRGRLEAVSVCVEEQPDKPLTATRHRIPFAQIVDQARDMHLKKLRHIEFIAQKGFLGSDAPASRVAERAGRQADEMERRPQKPGRPVYVDDAFLREVAATYNRAYADGKNATQAVRDAFSVSYSTANRYVQRARDKRFLPRTKPGRPKGNGRKS